MTQTLSAKKLTLEALAEKVELYGLSGTATLLRVSVAQLQDWLNPVPEIKTPPVTPPAEPLRKAREYVEVIIAQLPAPVPKPVTAADRAAMLHQLASRPGGSPASAVLLASRLGIGTTRAEQILGELEREGQVSEWVGKWKLL